MALANSRTPSPERTHHPHGVMMQGSNPSTSGAHSGGNREYREQSLRPLGPVANALIGPPRREIDQSNQSSFSAVGLAGQRRRPLPALSLTQTQLAFRYNAPLMRPMSRHVRRPESQHGHDRRVKQFRSFEGVRRPETHEAVAARLVETPPMSLQQLLTANMESALSVPALLHQGDLSLGLESPGFVPTTALAAQRHETPHIQDPPPPQAQQATRALPNVEGMPPNNSESAGEAASMLCVVIWGDPDPEKPWKRRDAPEDKKRKGEMSRVHGACVRCKKVRKQCNAARVCRLCYQRGLVCVRTCESCWSNKHVCDDGFPCKNCQSSGATCLRPSGSNTETEDEPQSDLLDIPLEEARTGSSSARVNKHNIRENGRQICGPTAWGISFDVESEPANSDGLEAMSVSSDDAPLGIQTYSQQSTDVDPRYTSTNNGRTDSPFADNTLQVPGRQHGSSEMPSEDTESNSFYDDATHFSRQDSPPLKDVNADEWDLGGENVLSADVLMDDWVGQ